MLARVCGALVSNLYYYNLILLKNVAADEHLPFGPAKSNLTAAAETAETTSGLAADLNAFDDLKNIDSGRKLIFMQ